MDAEELSHIYGYGYESSTAEGRIPYTYNYNPDYDYPLPNWADPRWAPSPDSPNTTVYAPQQRITGPYGQVVRLAEATPVGNPNQKRPFRLLLLLGLLLVLLFGMLEAF